MFDLFLRLLKETFTTVAPLRAAMAAISIESRVPSVVLLSTGSPVLRHLHVIVWLLGHDTFSGLMITYFFDRASCYG